MIGMDRDLVDEEFQDPPLFGGKQFRSQLLELGQFLAYGFLGNRRIVPLDLLGRLRDHLGRCQGRRDLFDNNMIEFGGGNPRDGTGRGFPP